MGSGGSTPAGVSPTAAGLCREAGARFSLPSIAPHENHELFRFHTSEKKAAHPAWSRQGCDTKSFFLEEHLLFPKV